MPVDYQYRRIVLECDSCDEVFEGEPGEEFATVWSAAKRKGWKARKIGNEWVRGCPGCGV